MQENFKKIITSSEFLISSIVVFAGVTAYYTYEFCLNYRGANLFDQAMYWLAYILVNLFLQYVIYINAKRQLSRKR